MAVSSPDEAISKSSIDLSGSQNRVKVLVRCSQSVFQELGEVGHLGLKSECEAAQTSLCRRHGPARYCGRKLSSQFDPTARNTYMYVLHVCNLKRPPIHGTS